MPTDAVKFAQELIDDNPEAKAEYDRLEREFKLRRARIKARRRKGQPS